MDDALIRMKFIFYLKTIVLLIKNSLKLNTTPNNFQNIKHKMQNMDRLYPGLLKYSLSV